MMLKRAKTCAELAAAEAELEKAREGRIPNTPELKERYAAARKAVAEAEAEVAQKRLIANQAGALAVVDACQYVPHNVTDVQAWDADLIHDDN